jgi:hypothetical protein
MELEEAIEILKSYENKLVYEISEKDKEAVTVVLNHLTKQEKRISDLEFALMDMVLQFADESKDSMNTMGLSALETAFSELDFDNPMPIKKVHEQYKKLAKQYFEEKAEE